MSDVVLFQSIKAVVLESKQRLFRVANNALLQTYWQIGKLIVEDDQQGNPTAIYGEKTLKQLAAQLNQEFGKGFDYTNLTNMRKFYLSFPIRDAMRHILEYGLQLTFDPDFNNIESNLIKNPF